MYCLCMNAFVIKFLLIYLLLVNYALHGLLTIFVCMYELRITTTITEKAHLDETRLNVKMIKASAFVWMHVMYVCMCVVMN